MKIEKQTTFLAPHVLGGTLQELLLLAEGSCIESLWFVYKTRVLLQFKKVLLMLELDPKIAALFLFHLPTEERFNKPSFLVSNLDPSITSLWKQLLVGSTLIGGWLNSSHCLVFLMENRDKQPFRLILKMQKRVPSLFYEQEGKILYAFPSKRELGEKLLGALFDETRLNLPSESSKNSLYPKWKELEKAYLREIQEKAIHDYYKPLIEKLSKKLSKSLHTLSTMPSPEAFAHQGTLLQAFRHLYKKGDQSLEVIDWVDGKSKLVPISKHDIQEQIHHLFGRAKGLRLHASELQMQVKAIETKIKNYCIKYESDLKNLKLSASSPKPKNTKKEHKQAKPYRCFTYEDAKIYVGKGDRENLIVSFEMACGNDLWLHVKDYPGSHVIVKAKKITPSLLQAAALLAHHYSQARKCSGVDVSYTLAKHVHKLPGAKTGTVGIAASKIYYSRYDETLLKYLFESKL